MPRFGIELGGSQRPSARYTTLYEHQPGRVAQSVGHPTRKSGVLGSIPGLVSYWRKYVHEVLVNRLAGLSMPRKSVVRLTDRPDMTLDVYRGRKTTIQQQQCMNIDATPLRCVDADSMLF